MSDKIVCPVCGQIDQLQKVSAIRNTGITTGSFSGSTGEYSTLRASASTQLAQLLEPPQKPSPEFRWQVGCMVFCGLGTLVGVGIAILIPPQEEFFPRYFVVVFYGLLFLWLYSGFRKTTRRNQEKLPGELVKWTKQIQIYDRLYYCFRDDQVFDPETDKHYPPQDLTKILYE
jgi:hypothetical protein